jgi:hypothetical protein
MDLVKSSFGSLANSCLGLVLLVPFLLAAPVQCPSQQEPRRERVEPPAEAVYRSALNLREQGYVQAEEATLRYVITHYPGTRWAERARLDLAERE